MSTIFEPTIFTVLKINGSEIIVQNSESKTQYRRNVTHVKRKAEIDYDSGTVSTSSNPIPDPTSNNHQTITATAKHAQRTKRDRPMAAPQDGIHLHKRKRTAPARYGFDN